MRPSPKVSPLRTTAFSCCGGDGFAGAAGAGCAVGCACTTGCTGCCGCVACTMTGAGSGFAAMRPSVRRLLPPLSLGSAARSARSSLVLVPASLQECSGFATEVRRNQTDFAPHKALLSPVCAWRSIRRFRLYKERDSAHCPEAHREEMAAFLRRADEK